VIFGDGEGGFFGVGFGRAELPGRSQASFSQLALSVSLSRPSMKWIEFAGVQGNWKNHAKSLERDVLPKVRRRGWLVGKVRLAESATGVHCERKGPKNGRAAFDFPAPGFS